LLIKNTEKTEMSPLFSLVRKKYYCSTCSSQVSTNKNLFHRRNLQNTAYIIFMYEPNVFVLTSVVQSLMLFKSVCPPWLYRTTVSKLRPAGQIRPRIHLTRPRRHFVNNEKILYKKLL